jgi:two-component system cell cycle response regulator CtrA
MSADQHEIDRQRIAALERELDEARERIRQLEAIELGAAWVPPIEFGLTAGEACVVGCLAAHEGVSTKERIMLALYSQRPEEPPEIKIVDVFVCKARAKLKRFGVEIVTRWGLGYELTPAGRAIVNADQRPAA